MDLLISSFTLEIGNLTTGADGKLGEDLVTFNSHQVQKVCIPIISGLVGCAP
jgi:hypothetical protein